MTKKTWLEIFYDSNSDVFVFNIVFKSSGEIRQKRRSKEWVLNRLFNSELKTWKRNWDEDLVLLGCALEGNKND